ncbi:hypothetical protein JTE90_002418 [Oedothorax gibbosus]|uniref:Uncharacterized protein n=1 Tax=Oedothorax gibbosus TaxID=931172 RepID=A0AAV6UVR6_9ARAC|nr:hypothetical protein JTE90_002418 [Oedothorax gibbosus]
MVTNTSSRKKNGYPHTAPAKEFDTTLELRTTRLRYSEIRMDHLIHQVPNSRISGGNRCHGFVSFTEIKNDGKNKMENRDASTQQKAAIKKREKIKLLVLQVF